MCLKGFGSPLRGCRSVRPGILFFLCLSIFRAGPARAEWNSTNADCRYRIERTGDAGGKTDTGYFLLWSNDRAASNTCIEVFGANGRQVGCEILWSAEGEALKVRFDASGQESSYEVYTGPGPVHSPVWVPRGGLVIETRKRGEGDPVNAAAIRQLCDTSGPVLGRSLIPDIFLGIHPHGPAKDFVSIIEGLFQVEKPGDYGFATISEDASCILIDGKAIAAWPGWHGCQGGRLGQYQGRITLSAGLHRIAYYNVKQGEGYTVTAAWQPPGQDRFDVMPAGRFVPVSTYTVTGCESAPSRQNVAHFECAITGHFTIGSATLVLASFRALDEGRRYRWEFDDGTREEGALTEHVFLSPGMRTVKLEVQNREGSSTGSQRVLVHPLWTQDKDQPKHLFKAERRRLEREDLRAAPVADLVSVYRIAADEEDLMMARRFAALCLQRKGDFDAITANVFCEMARFVQRPDLQEYGLAADAFELVIESPLFTPAQKAWAHLHFSGLLIQYLGRVEAAQDHLQKVDMTLLPDPEQRLKRIYEADALFAQGHLDLARAAYVEVGTSYAPDNTALALKRQARLETARDYLRRGEYEGAEFMVRCIEWDAPEQRMATETGLIMIGICQGRKELQRALLLARKLLPVAETDTRKSELLQALVEIQFAMKHDAEAAVTYRQLLKDHPYSEAAARARDAWGSRADVDNK
ncbi:MAG: hypothetical protein A2340_13500 [Lentisphaerae bacterium RIFOXYB12_FULL_60_10]|nr:MAG: hypothetical protein A2269_08390 [Lentisphaerae bacterium RIFOXYA12_FULL_60_10]OGV84170.1 MAG: hypothetical protein A2340_13500 [Lentisphaerae bacterium RIFOXYB12_FULL_60_10]